MTLGAAPTAILLAAMTVRSRVLSRPVAAVAALAAIAVIAPAAHAPAAHAATFPVSVFKTPVTRPLASDFLGLAIENNTVPAWAGRSGQPSDVALRGLVRALTPTGTASVRVGGQSTDRSWWPVPGLKRPLGVTATLGPTWTDAAQRLATTADARLILGVNLEAGSARVAATEAGAFLKRVGRSHIAGLQLGNEPDLYLHTPWYRRDGSTVLPWYSHTGTPVLSRDSSWTSATFGDQFASFARAIPGIPLAGPESGYAPWINAFARRFMTRHSRVRTLTTHAYGLNNCIRDRSSPEFPTVAHMLTQYASRTLLTGVAGEVGVAHRAGAAFRIDEMGSVTCNGYAGVSNTFASALWAMDALFAVARAGVDGVNLHTYPGSLNGLFDIAYHSSDKQWHAAVHPLYDGVVMFARAAPPGSRLLRIATPAQETVRAWATLGADRRVRVLVINDSTTAATDARIHPPAGYGAAAGTVQRLTAPSAGATGGILLGGHRFGSTVTGVPPAPVTTSAAPAQGAFTVHVPAASAALLTAAPASR